ncbi:MAG: hypothetical protein MJ231_09135, partial [bacterium]|nr:hypothetical protein [bacterium]
MKKIKIGFVGLGQRGKGMLSTFLGLENVDVVALCDVYQDRVDELAKIVKDESNIDVTNYNNFELML